MPPDVIEKCVMDLPKKGGLANKGFGERICEGTYKWYGYSRRDPARACHRALPWAAAMTPRLMARPRTPDIDKKMAAMG